MINLPISWIVEQLNAKLHMPNNFDNINNYHCTSVSIDSRNILEKALFIAIKGPNFDGHDFIADIAVNSNAVACIVEHPLLEVSILQIVVPCCRQALKILAQAYRRLLPGKVIAVTGSNGKTSTKNMIATICAASGKTAATLGNLNNQLGLPLTLLNTARDNKFIVLELGTNSKGEIAELTAICSPDIVLITNAGHSHLEKLNSVFEVAIEKGAIITSSNAVTILNKDDQYYDYWYDLVTASKAEGNNKIINFSLHNTKADIFASECINTANGLEFILQIKSQRYPAFIPAWGNHQLINSCAATAVALAAGIDNKTIISGLAKISLANGRGKRHNLTNGSIIIDESYNANPDSVRSAIKQLSAYTSEKTLMVFADMLDLGKDSIKYHQQIGEYALEQGINQLLTVGYFAKFASEKFGGKHFVSNTELIKFLNNQLDKKIVILIKGSNKMALVKIVKALLEKDRGDIKCCYG